MAESPKITNFKALTIAGSDSGGGAGIQADLKTFAALGVYGTSALTALTAQNTLGVQGVFGVTPGFVSEQIDSIMADIGADAVKTGMLLNAGIIEAVALKIQQYKVQNLVVDPVMVAKGGDLLLQPEAIEALRTLLAPLSLVITPNIPEAGALAGMKIDGSDEDALKEAASRIYSLGAKNVLIKGGHRQGPAVDLLFDGEHFLYFEEERVQTRHSHGTGCTLSAAIAAFLARGYDVPHAILEAKTYLTGALKAAFAVGSPEGHSPVAHFYRGVL